MIEEEVDMEDDEDRGGTCGELGSDGGNDCESGVVDESVPCPDAADG